MHKYLIFIFIVFTGLLFSCQNKEEEIRKELNTGNKMWYDGDENGALTHYERVLELDPKNAEAIVLIGNVYYQWQKYDDAFKYYSLAIETDSLYGIAYKKRGDIHNLRNDFSKKCADYKKADALGVENLTNLIQNCP